MHFTSNNEVLVGIDVANLQKRKLKVKFMAPLQLCPGRDKRCGTRIAARDASGIQSIVIALPALGQPAGTALRLVRPTDSIVADVRVSG